MALVALLRGVNVGGHKTFRPSLLAQDLRHLGVVSIGAAGSFVARGATDRKELRAEISRRLPFDAEVVICSGSDVLRLASGDPFAGQVDLQDVVPFVSVLAKRRPPVAPMPLDLPASGPWGVRILAHRGQFVVGLYRREMKGIAHLGRIEQILGVPATTRNWRTMLAIARVLAGESAP
jgi:uncharacterized protein (DUF1697 family)